jgi:membrane associated rhomboid family serine protease
MSAPVVQTSDQPFRRVARPTVVAGAIDALIVVVWFAVAGVVGAVVWWQVTPLPKVTKTGGSASLTPEELVKQVGIDGWFFVVAAVGGLLSGLILLIWRRRDPLLMVLLVVLGGGLAAWLMIRVGLTLGPEKEITALAGKPDGAQVPMQLKLRAPGIAFVWSIGAAVGALIYVWILRKPPDEQS